MDTRIESAGNKRIPVMEIVAALVILCAISARVVGKMGYFSIEAGIIRTMLYIGLYMGWLISVRKRVIHIKIRRYITAICVIMIVWFALRTARYFFIIDEDIARHLWYMYSLPSMIIPMLAVFVSMSIGKPADYELPRPAYLLYVPTTVLAVMVMTNDIHFQVFSFPEGAILSEAGRTLQWGYYVLSAWSIICSLATFVLLVMRTRTSRLKIIIPVVMMMFTIAYACVYVYSGEVYWFRLIGGDVAAVMCLMMAGIIESGIRFGLIPTNNGHDIMFEAGSLKAQIADAEGNIRYSNANAPTLDRKTIQQSYREPVSIDRNTRLKSSSIPGGHVIWVEDVSEITQVLEDLEENCRTIAERNSIDIENYKVKKRINVLREKNRLYDRLQTKTARAVEILNGILEDFSLEEDDEKARMLLARAAVIGSYVKRCGNLMLIEEGNRFTDISELSLCLRESFDSLNLMGIECAMSVPDGATVEVADAIRVYDFFEEVMECSLDSLMSVWLKGRILGDKVIFRMEVECSTALSHVGEKAESAEYEDGVWSYTLSAGREGAV